jgi:hypothetical protein
MVEIMNRPGDQSNNIHPFNVQPYAVIYGLALLKRGIMVPETC